MGIKEGKFYFPIYKLKKNSKKDKNIKLKTKYTNSEDHDIIDSLKNYYNTSCTNTIINKINKSTHYYNKDMINTLESNNIIFPVTESGTIYKYPHKELNKFNNFNSLTDVL